MRWPNTGLRSIGLYGPAIPTLEIFIMASPSGRCASFSSAMVNCGNRGSLPAAGVGELWPARNPNNNPRPADSSATAAPPSLRNVVMDVSPVVSVVARLVLATTRIKAPEQDNPGGRGQAPPRTPKLVQYNRNPIYVPGRDLSSRKTA